MPKHSCLADRTATTIRRTPLPATQGWRRARCICPSELRQRAMSGAITALEWRRDDARSARRDMSTYMSQRWYRAHCYSSCPRHHPMRLHVHAWSPWYLACARFSLACLLLMPRTGTSPSARTLPCQHICIALAHVPPTRLALQWLICMSRLTTAQPTTFSRPADRRRRGN